MAVRQRRDSRRELWFWRATTGVALAVCAFLPFQNTRASVSEAESESAVESRGEARRGHAARERVSADARVRNLLASLERTQSASMRCGYIDRIARLPSIDEGAVAQVARFSEPEHPLELRRCTGYALGLAAHEAAIAPLVALAQSDNTSLVETALVALAGRGECAAHKAAVELSANRSRSLRVSVACALAESGAPEGLTLIAELLREGNGFDRDRLLMALGRGGDPRAVGLLQSYINQSNRAAQQSAIYALGEIGGPAATETLLSLLNERPELAQPATNALARTGSDEAREALLTLAEKQVGYGAGLFALQALADLDGPGVQEVMTHALDSTLTAQGTAIEYFINHPQHDIFAKLESFARTGAPQVSMLSLQALARIGGAEGFDVIESVAKSGGQLAPMALQLLTQDPEPTRARRIALEQVKSGNASAIEMLVQDDSVEARTALIELAQKGESGVASRALWSLAQRNDPEARKVTEALASNPDPQKRASAMWALAQSGDAAVVGTLKKALGDSDENVRREAVQALGQLPGAESEAALLSATRDASPEVVGAASNMLATLGTPAAIERIEQVTRNPATAGQGMMALLNSAPARAQVVAESLIASKDLESRRAALMATSQLPSEVSSRVLLSALGDRDAEFVREAVEAASNSMPSDEVRTALRKLSPDLPEDLRTRAAEVANGASPGYAMHMHHDY